MDWWRRPIPRMRLEQRFGDRLVSAFRERPGSVWRMVADAAAKHPEREALVCGAARLNWIEAAQRAVPICPTLRIC